jgi:hypothetical protein
MRIDLEYPHNVFHLFLYPLSLQGGKKILIFVPCTETKMVFINIFMNQTYFLSCVCPFHHELRSTRCPHSHYGVFSVR